MHTPHWHGVDPRVRSQIEGALASLTKDWPGVEPAAIHFKNIGGGYAATNRVTGEIEFNSRFASDYDAWVASCQEDTDTVRQALGNGKWTSRVSAHYRAQEAPARYGITHEFGHLIDMAIWGYGIGPTGQEERVAGYLDLSTLAAKAADPDTFEGGDTASDHAIVALTMPLGFFDKAIAEDLSMYATTAPPELLAEGFAIGTLFPGASASADAILAYLREQFASHSIQHAA